MADWYASGQFSLGETVSVFGERYGSGGLRVFAVCDPVFDIDVVYIGRTIRIPDPERSGDVRNGDSSNRGAEGSTEIVRASTTSPGLTVATIGVAFDFDRDGMYDYVAGMSPAHLLTTGLRNDFGPSLWPGGSVTPSQRQLAAGMSTEPVFTYTAAAVPGDTDGIFITPDSDLGETRDNSQSLPQIELSHAPEPGSLLMAGFFLAGSLLRRRRR
jgi:hypothetical protein